MRGLLNISHSDIVVKPLPITKFGNRRKWELKKNLKFLHIFNNSTDEYVVIPKDEVFDGASVPRTLISVLSPVGILFTASIVHDYLYNYRYLWYSINGSWKKIMENPTRKECDDLFYRMIIETNPDIKSIKYWAKIAYMGVRVGGWLVWNRAQTVDPPYYDDDLSAA